jgi:hypothetical protein
VVVVLSKEPPPQHTTPYAQVFAVVLIAEIATDSTAYNTSDSVEK